MRFGGGHDVTLAEGATDEGALQRVGRALQAQILLRGREDDAGGGLRLGTPNLDDIARADAGIGALKPVDAQDIEALVLWIRAHGAGRGGLLADDLDHVAFTDAERGHQRARQMGEAPA